MLVSVVACTTNEQKKVSEEKIKVGKVEFKEQDSGEWAMTGNVINVNDYDIRGKVDVALFNKNDQTISEFTALVNNGNPITPGDSGVFKYEAAKSNFAGATRYHIKFIGEE